MEFTRATIRGGVDGIMHMVGLTGPGPDTGESMILKEGMDNLAEKAHATAREKGFWDHEDLLCPVDPSEPRYTPTEPSVSNPSIVMEKLCLIHTEVSEASEAWRDTAAPSGAMEEELADAIIRILDLAAACGYSMDTAVRAKMTKNLDRPHMHGRKM